MVTIDGDAMNQSLIHAYSVLLPVSILFFFRTQGECVCKENPAFDPGMDSFRTWAEDRCTVLFRLPA